MREREFTGAWWFVFEDKARREERRAAIVRMAQAAEALGDYDKFIEPDDDRVP